VDDGELSLSLNFRLTFSTIPLLDETFEWDVPAMEILETSIVGGVDGKMGKSSSSRPGGFGCSGVKLFLKESEELGLYDLFASNAGSAESGSNERTCSGGDIGASLTELTGGGVETNIDDDDDDDEDDDDDDDGGGAGTADTVTVAAATAANSSSAFRIKSKSLKVLNVLLLSLEISSDAFSD